MHLLDDFLTIDDPRDDGFRTMALLTHVFHVLGIPLAAHKCLGPVTKLEYLGIILDTANMEARLPHDKQARISNMLTSFLAKRTSTKRELLSLLGHLVFASRVIVPGRTFMSRLFEAARKVRESAHVPDHLLQVLRRWHSDSYKRYIRTPESAIRSAQQNMADHSCI